VHKTIIVADGVQVQVAANGDNYSKMAAVPQPDIDQMKREEKEIVEETKQAGGTVHEFDPNSTPQQKAAAAGKVSVNCMTVCLQTC
jgi:hypothetical protein